MDRAIPVPARTADRLRALIAQRNQLNEMIEMIVTTAAELLDVPAEYALTNIDVGWEPRATKQ